MTKRLIGYGAARGAVDALTSVRGIALASILGAESFGVWLLFRIFLRYLSFAGLGMQRGLEFSVASERDPEGWGKAGVALVLAIFVPLGLLALLAGMLWNDGPVATALLAVGAMILVNRLWILGSTYLRGAGALRDLARLEVIVGLLQAVLVVLLAFWFGLPGTFAGMFAGFLAGALLFFAGRPLPPVWDGQRAAAMIRIGFPVTLSGLLLASFSFSDRLVVGAFLGVKALGLYGFAIAAAEIGQNLANVTRTVVLPDIYRRTDTAGGGAADAGQMHRVLTGFSIYVPIICGYFAVMIGPAVSAVAPEFNDAIPVTRTYLFVAALHGLSILATLGVVARGQQALLPILSLAGIALNVALSYALLQRGGGLSEVAVAALISHSLHACAIMVLVSDNHRRSLAALQAVKILFPVFWCLAAVHLVLWLVPTTSFGTFAAAMVCFTLAIAPLALSLRSGGPARGPRR
ncbi:lipopolysaccharide biosynthesis protein [Tropicimonas sediminicola]|uniref:Membrane protein involved in the export of O-antigen and teichoic acid n=1 Tax=Tropicimonas sediminicola TaxID=1031541 RepID=A0A239EFL0_9RHOB|nr:oligosaccharide flippase family protein [Tropicimonas sediminicola]SNS43436.1 Membrane protein involved in the export of O-antigen and teichoic acid [Tropicimonas sediminicola]